METRPTHPSARMETPSPPSVSVCAQVSHVDALMQALDSPAPVGRHRRLVPTAVLPTGRSTTPSGGVKVKVGGDR